MAGRRPSPTPRIKASGTGAPPDWFDLGAFPCHLVATVSRDCNGNPRYQSEFKVLVPHDATEGELRAAWNHPDGELPPEDVLVRFRRPEKRRSEV